MTVGATGSSTSTQQQQQTSTTTGNAAGNLNYDSFLKLLTAQMKFQDPTKPMDSTQFVAQLHIPQSDHRMRPLVRNGDRKFGILFALRVM